jgi:hypothetical protein
LPSPKPIELFRKSPSENTPSIVTRDRDNKGTPSFNVPFRPLYSDMYVFTVAKKFGQSKLLTITLEQIHSITEPWLIRICKSSFQTQKW